MHGEKRAEEVPPLRWARHRHGLVLGWGAGARTGGATYKGTSRTQISVNALGVRKCNTYEYDFTVGMYDITVSTKML